LSTIARVAVRLPLALGLKDTLIVHCAPTATEPGQVLAWVKSAELAPVTDMLDIVKLALPVFWRLTF